MSTTLVIQSHRSPLPYQWIASCLDSVKSWARHSGYDYRFTGDELFERLPADMRNKYSRVIQSDLARLLVLRDALEQGYEMAVWLDADFLVFAEKDFILPDSKYAVGREVWVQYEDKKPRVHKKVHNAFLMFSKGNSFLDFYIDIAMKMLTDNKGVVPGQFIGPKLLTALHNTVQLPVMEAAGMLGPAVIHDLINGTNKALSLFHKRTVHPVAGVNLCISSCDKEEVSPQQMTRVIELLVASGL